TLNPIEYGYDDTQFVDITTGSGKVTWDVQSTGVPTTLINTSGQETVDVGNGGLLSGIQGRLTVENEGEPEFKSPAAINLVVDDSADPSPKTATITAGSIAGFARAEVDYLSSDLKSLTLDGGRGGNTFNVQALGPGTPVTINTGSG